MVVVGRGCRDCSTLKAKGGGEEGGEREVEVDGFPLAPDLEISDFVYTSYSGV